MQAVIMAAGQSTRIYPLNLVRPKPLMRIWNKCILKRDLDQLNGLVDEVIIIVGYKKELIVKKIGGKYKDLTINYIEQKERKGTGHAVLQVKDLIKDKFIVINGDDLYSKKDKKNCLKHKYCVLGKETKEPWRFGVFGLDGNKVKSLVEKPKNVISGIVNTGVYVFDRKIFDILKKVKVSERGEIEITDAVRELAKKEEVYCEIVKDYWYPIGTVKDWIRVNLIFLKRVFFK